MRLGTAQAIAEGLAAVAPEARVEFAMHGEPLAHRDAPVLVALMRALLPRAQMQLTTNGELLAGRMASRVRELFDAGLDFLVVDTYSDSRDTLRAEAQAIGRGVRVVDFYVDCVPRGWSPWANHRRRQRRLVVLMDDLAERNGEHGSRVIVNHAGASPAAPLPREPLARTCTNPFREISFTWDGEVRVCCMDWRGDFPCGNVRTHSVADIWWGERFMAARRMLAAKDRRFAPCAWCDKGSGARAGLLPKLPGPNGTTLAIVADATRREVGDGWPAGAQPPPLLGHQRKEAPCASP